MNYECGRLRRTADGKWFFGDVEIGEDGFLDEARLVAALRAVTTPPRSIEQLDLVWPVDPPGLLPVTPEETVREAHARLWPKLDSGALCPVCHRTARRYRRTFHREMGVWLLRLVDRFLEQGSRRYISVRELPGYQGTAKSSTDGAYLVQWKLVRRHPTRTREGLYWPTPTGIAFAQGKITVPSAAWIYDGHAHHFSTKQVGLAEVLATALDVGGMLRDVDGHEGR